MRKSLLFVWACMGLVCLVSACKTSVKSKEWKLVWVENFDQKNSFDESVWTKIPRGTSDWNNYMSFISSSLYSSFILAKIASTSVSGVRSMRFLAMK